MLAFDFFGAGFSFNVNRGNKKKQTRFGFIFTIMIIGLSLAYLIYLLTQYISGELSPRVTQKQVQKAHKIYTLKNTPLQFSLSLPDEQTFQNLFTQFPDFALDVQSKNLQEAFNGYGLISNIGGDESQSFKGVDLVQCPPSEIVGDQSNKYCIDTSKDDITLYSDFQGGQIPLYFIIGRCQMNNPSPENCISTQSQDLIMQQINFGFQIDILTENFDSDDEKVTKTLYKKVFPGDTELVENAQIIFKESHTHYDKNILVSSGKKDVQDHLQEFTIEQTTLSKGHVYRKYGQILGAENPGDILLILEIYIDLEENNTHIEYVKISEVFAMFLGVFNSLMTIGILAKLISESVIIEDLMENSLITSYKLTAMQLKQQNFDQAKKDHIIKSNNGLQSFKRVNMGAKSCGSNDDNKIHSSQDIINNITYEQIYDIMRERYNEQINIMTICNQLYILKQGLQILLSSQQYAALLNCGKRLPDFVDLKDQNVNHLEIMEQVENNKQLQDQYFQEGFIQKIQNHPEQLSQVDKNILSCLVYLDDNKQQDSLSEKIININEENFVAGSDRNLIKQESEKLDKKSININNPLKQTQPPGQQQNI